MKPQITIITPCFNSLQFIESCLQNVINQRCDGIEHLIMDAGSTDGTLDVIKKYAAIHPSIKYISEKDKGQSDAMNKGIKLANAEVIGFLNVDDGYFPFVLKRILFLFEHSTSLQFISGNCKLVDLEGNLLYINRPERIKYYHLYSAEEPFPINPAAYFYKKKLHDKHGFYNVDNHFNMDFEFILNVVAKENASYFNEDWGYMVQHGQAKTSLDNDLSERKRKLIQTCYQQLSFTQKAKVAAYKFYKTVRG